MTALTLPLTVKAEDQQSQLDASTLIYKLSDMTQNISSIQRFTERGDLGRLLILQKTIQKASDATKQNGLLNQKTMNAFLEMSISFRYSQAFFANITTEETKQNILAVISAVGGITKLMGLDESPATQVTANILTQIKQLNDQLGKMDITTNLKLKLAQINPDLGKAIAEARQGDRPLAFEAADKVMKKYYQLSPEFNNVLSGKEAFAVVIEIQGLIEFYDEFAQYSERFGGGK
jgi:hypothetical protein